MRPRRGAGPGASLARRQRGLFLGGLAAGALAALAAWIVIPGGRRNTAPAVPARIPAARISFPRASPESRPYVDRAVEELRRADMQLDSGGNPALAEPALASAFGLIGKAGAWTPDLAGHHWLLSTTAFSSGRAADAEALARAWVERFPEDYHHQLLLGKVRYWMGRWEPARESLSAAARLHPGEWEPWHWLAEACFQMGAREEGIAAVRGALDAIGYPAERCWTHPKAVEVLGNAVKVLHRFREYELLARVARDYRTRIPGIAPEATAECSMAEGVALAEMGRHEESEPLLRAALAARTNTDEVAFHLGMALAKRGKLEEARSTFADLLVRSPHFARAYHQLGLVLSRLGKADAAGAMFAKSRELAPSERESRREQELRGAGRPGRAAAAEATGHVLAGRIPEAEAALRKKQLRDEPGAVFALASLYIDWLRSLDADRVLDHGGALVGESHPDTLGHRGLALLLRGDQTAGLERLRAAAGAAEPGAWPARLARALLDAGDAKAAIAALEPARKGNEDREVSFLLGQARLESGDPARALELLRGISTADTRWDSWEGDAWLARALAEGGGPADLEAAASALERVPPERRSTRACLRARIAVLERKAGGAAEMEAARSALARHDALESGARDLRRRIASSPWPGSAPLYRELARLEAARGLELEAVRWARLALHADPASAEALRDLASWLRGEGDVFYRLRALQDLIRIAPGDAQASTEIAKLGAWLGQPSGG